ncbi:MAG: Fic family protein [Gammaproteobacteria bacterium]|nr:Fic family protein [Gammaproteobacteria bacterium]MCW8973859.1 Fic family protein [Gammaproteobacteria bacterium]MCW8992739.1 Fic family protein [Gammaproteobacteria bacterium]
MDINNYQAGHYKQQYEYKSFVPEPINHPWEVVDGEVQRLLSDADRALGELNAFSQLVPNVDFFIKMHITKEATQSSRIEGTRTNMEEALLDEEDIDPEKRDDWEEVQNYIKAINGAIGQLQTLPLSNRLLRDTHRTLMQGVRGETKLPGEFRASQNWIGVSLKNAAFVPPHHEEVPELMSDLEKFIHNEELQVPHLIKVAIAHYQFETIHPFLDGNGRLGRLMIAIYLANFGLLHKPALYLSDYFERNKTEYVDRLMAVRQANQLKEWLIFFLFGVKETAENSIQVFKDILALKERLEREVLPHFSTRRQENAQTLMQYLYQMPLVSINDVAEMLGLKHNTASTLVNDFVKHGVLRELTGKQRNRVYGFHEYLMIFNRRDK